MVNFVKAPYLDSKDPHARLRPKVIGWIRGHHIPEAAAGQVILAGAGVPFFVCAPQYMKLYSRKGCKSDLGSHWVESP